MRTFLLRTAAMAVALSFSPAVFAALPFGSLVFVEPSATVGPNAVIDVRMRFTVDQASSPLQLATGDL